MAAPDKWTEVTSPTSGDYLERIKVPGGWLYRTIFIRDFDNPEVSYSPGIAMVFVPYVKTND